MKNYQYILFDLDGTLVASAESVRVSIAHAMEALSLPCPDLSDYSMYVGPPLEDTFRGMCAVPEPLILEAMEIYRDYFDEVGQQYSALFDGVTDMLDSLRQKGKKLAICTSKNEPVAEKVAQVMGLAPYFDAICGSTLDGVDFLGVTYGYGTVESMRACGAVGFADSPKVIADML